MIPRRARPPLDLRSCVIGPCTRNFVPSILFGIDILHLMYGLLVHLTLSHSDRITFCPLYKRAGVYLNTPNAQTFTSMSTCLPTSRTSGTIPCLLWVFSNCKNCTRCLIQGKNRLFGSTLNWYIAHVAICTSDHFFQHMNGIIFHFSIFMNRLFSQD